MLYIVGTPIGNLEDISFRQASVLTSSDIILAEDTRSTKYLLSRVEEMFGITTKADQKVLSFYKEVEFQKLPEVLEYLSEGKNISLVSESGMPLISDPGYLLLQSAIKEEYPYTVIPGPTAAFSGLVASGLEIQTSFFIGFLPKKDKDVSKLLLKLQKIQEIMKDVVFVAYESPHRINKTLGHLHTYFPHAEVVVARELTKKFEEIIRGKAEDLKNLTYKGEITLLWS